MFSKQEKQIEKMKEWSQINEDPNWTLYVSIPKVTIIHKVYLTNTNNI